MPSFSVLIPAYNEASTVSSVVHAALTSGALEVWVVSDGSSDHTAQKARQAGAKVLELTPNRGKGGAVAAGLEQIRAGAEIVVLLDADLMGLSPRHIHTLLAPLEGGQADMSVGLFRAGRAHTTAASRLTRDWSGQRAIVRARLEDLDLTHTRFALELALTDHLKAQGGKVVYVSLENLTHRLKEEKLGLWSGLCSRVKMLAQLLEFRLRGKSGKRS